MAITVRAEWTDSHRMPTSATIMPPQLALPPLELGRDQLFGIGRHGEMPHDVHRRARGQQDREQHDDRGMTSADRDDTADQRRANGQERLGDGCEDSGVVAGVVAEPVKLCLWRLYCEWTSRDRWP